MNHSNRLEELVTKHENTLFRTALAILGNVQEAEDAVQETFLCYLEKRPEFRDGEHEKAWLLKVAANRYCDDALRRTEEAVAEAYDEIKQSRARFRAAANASAAAPHFRQRRRRWPCRHAKIITLSPPLICLIFMKRPAKNA